MKDDKHTALVGGQLISFDYTNHRGNREKRLIAYIGTEVSEPNMYHPERGLRLRCMDPSRQAERSFAIENIHIETFEVDPPIAPALYIRTKSVEELAEGSYNHHRILHNMGLPNWDQLTDPQKEAWRDVIRSMSRGV